ncbi:hypothetical protein B3286c1_1258 [Brucella vulpis]|nr:hypothetical protein BF3285c1_1259 [Brucella vulpis]CUW50071.1 hypothetical protein B3286c1_1258 [Brucella vulpis]
MNARHARSRADQVRHRGFRRCTFLDAAEYQHCFHALGANRIDNVDCSAGGSERSNFVGLVGIECHRLTDRKNLRISIRCDYGSTDGRNVRNFH